MFRIIFMKPSRIINSVIAYNAYTGFNNLCMETVFKFINHNSSTKTVCVIHYFKCYCGFLEQFEINYPLKSEGKWVQLKIFNGTTPFDTSF